MFQFQFEFLVSFLRTCDKNRQPQQMVNEIFHKLKLSITSARNIREEVDITALESRGYCLEQSCSIAYKTGK